MIEEQMHLLVNNLDTSLELGCSSVHIVTHKKKIFFTLLAIRCTLHLTNNLFAFF
jgi:hypothetical protein